MANSITYSRMLFVVPIGFAVYSGWFKVALILFLIAALTDWLDGFVARKLGQVTDVGKVMDQIADKVLITSVMIFLVDLGEIPSWLVVSVVWRDMVVSAIRILAAGSGNIIQANVFGKMKTVSQMILVVWILSRIGYQPVTTFLVWVVFISTVLSGLIYTFQNREILKT